MEALSLVGTVLEFARFGIELLSDARELYKSTHGALSVNEQLRLATVDLRELLVKLRTREGLPAVAEHENGQTTFQHILAGTEKAAEDLLLRLEQLRAKSTKDRKWQSVRKAVRTVCTKVEIESLKGELAGFKDAVQTHVLYSILKTLDEESLGKSERFDRLDEQTQLIISSLLDATHRVKETTKLAQEVQDQMQTLSQLAHRMDVVQDGLHRPRTIVPSEQQVKDGLARIGDIVEITASFEMLDVSHVQETELRHTVQNDILASLAYESMTERYEDIMEAFPETFNWAFEDSATGKTQWNNLPKWLKTGSGVYWISGKAGSGKSTLMKHIFDDSRTRDYLKQWVRKDVRLAKNEEDIRFCLATFFFWNSGTVDQKSQNGLLRALLYQVLSRFPELISVVFPEMWAKRYSDRIQEIQRFQNRAWKFDEALTLGRLTSAFRKLAQQTMVPLKLCFLVDGLDEYSGDHEDLALLFKMATESPMVKICVSSRPWVIFEQIYGSRSSMRLQDLTCNDIGHYVRSKFDLNPAFAKLQENDSDSATFLRNEVIEKAEGVFLWVEIVVRSLLFGIRNQDDIGILRQRLMAMPQELESLYLHLLSLIDSVYYVWASEAFQVVCAARDLCTEEAAGPARRSEGSTALTLPTFFFAMTKNIEFHAQASGETTLIEKATLMNIRILTPEVLEAKWNISKTHLTARCAGLLEVPQFDRRGFQAPIRFHHRTAREFIYGSVRWRQMLDHTKDTTFDPHKVLFTASVLDLASKAANPSTESGEMYSTVTDALLYAYHINTHQIQNDTETLVLNILDQIMSGWTTADADDWGSDTESARWADRMIDVHLDLSANMNMMKLATVYGLTNYVNEKLSQLDRKSAAQTASALLQVLRRRRPQRNEPWAGVLPPLQRPEMVSTLVRHGVDPNFNIREPRSPHGLVMSGDATEQISNSLMFKISWR